MGVNIALKLLHLFHLLHLLEKKILIFWWKVSGHPACYYATVGSYMKHFLSRLSKNLSNSEYFFLDPKSWNMHRAWDWEMTVWKKNSLLEPLSDLKVLAVKKVFIFWTQTSFIVIAFHCIRRKGFLERHYASKS